MYLKYKFKVKGFNEEEVEELYCNNLNKKNIEEIKTELLKHGFTYKGNYKKIINEMEYILLNELLSMADYDYSHDEIQKNEINNLLTMKVMNEDVFNKEYCLVDKSNWQPYHGYYTKNLPLIIANEEIYYKANNSIYKLETDMKNNFGIEFLDRKIDCKEFECESYSNEYDFSKPVLNNNKPLMILQKLHRYMDGEPGYTCYNIHYDLIIVNS